MKNFFGYFSGRTWVLGTIAVLLFAAVAFSNILDGLTVTNSAASSDYIHVAKPNGQGGYFDVLVPATAFAGTTNSTLTVIYVTNAPASVTITNWAYVSFNGTNYYLPLCK